MSCKYVFVKLKNYFEWLEYFGLCSTMIKTISYIYILMFSCKTNRYGRLYTLPNLVLQSVHIMLVSLFLVSCLTGSTIYLFNVCTYITRSKNTLLHVHTGILCYDDRCHLRKYCQNPSLTTAAAAMANWNHH